MACSKHIQRKRTGCSDCYPVEACVSMAGEVYVPEVINDNTETKTIIKKHAKVALDKESLELVGDIKEALNGPKESNEGYPRIEEGKYVRVLIEAEIQKALAKVKAEMNELRSIQWEHLHIPYSVFCLDLMYAMEKDNWKFVDFIKNPKQYGYSDSEDCVVFQRIKRKDNPPLPDFTKNGSVKRFVDKKNGKEA